MSTCPHLSPPLSTCPHLCPPVSTCPQLSPPVPTCPHLCPPVPTFPHLCPPVLTCPHLCPSMPALMLPWSLAPSPTGGRLGPVVTPLAVTLTVGPLPDQSLREMGSCEGTGWQDRSHPPTPTSTRGIRGSLAELGTCACVDWLLAQLQGPGCAG